jgi:hypothetical protein
MAIQTHARDERVFEYLSGIARPCDDGDGSGGGQQHGIQ